jgi:hypothetical protein
LSLLDLAGRVLVDENNKGGINQMATADGFQPDRSPIFLSEDAEKTEPDIGKALAREVISSRILKTSLLAVAATAIGIAVLSIGNPVALVANVADSWVDKSALQPGADPSTPTIQSIAGTQDLPPTTTEAPTRDEVAAASVPADQNQAEIGQPTVEALLKEFEAWAAKQDSRAEAVPVEPAQAAPVQVAQAAPVQAQPTKKHRRARSVHNARAEIRPQRIHRVRTREASAPVPIAPVPDARAPEQPVQNAQTPSLFQSLGWRN